MKKRVKILIDNNISILSYHHPLDLHPIIGNQIQFFKKIGIKPKGKFGYYEGESFGLHAKTKINRNELIKRINSAFGTNAKVYGNGPETVRNVCFVSGHGVIVLPEALKKGFDTFISGSITESNVDTARDANINLICAGHYNSEKLGIMALGKLLKKKFKTEIKFFDVNCKV